MNSTSATNEHIIMNFRWKGPNRTDGGWSKGGLDVKIVDLVFENAKTDISVHLSDDLPSSTSRTFPFTCRRYHETENEIRGHKFKSLAKETHPDSLKVRLEQIDGLTLKARFFEKSPNRGPAMCDSSTGKIKYEKRILRTDEKIELEVPKLLEAGATYTLVVKSDDLSLSARLKREKVKIDRDQSSEEQAPSRAEFSQRLNRMGEELIKEGIRNIHLASTGEGPSSRAEVFAHGVQGFVRAGQQIHPDIKVPTAKPPENSDLNSLTVEELQLRFEQAYVKDKKFEKARLKAALAGDIEKMNRIMNDELANSQFLIQIDEEMKKKGA
jgi:hypothetical protein